MKFLFYLFIYFILLLYNILLVLPYIDMNLPWVYMCSPFWTPLPPPSPYHHSGPSQCTSPKHPVSCIEPGLAIHFTYDNIHVSMPFSQIIPPLPSPPESKRLFCTSVYTAYTQYAVYTFRFLNMKLRAEELTQSDIIIVNRVNNRTLATTTRE